MISFKLFKNLFAKMLRNIFKNSVFRASISRIGSIVNFGSSFYDGKRKILMKDLIKHYGKESDLNSGK